METGEYLDAVVGDIGRLISWSLHGLEIFLGVSYVCGEKIFQLSMAAWGSILGGVEMLKLFGQEMWDFGGSIFKGILLLFYSLSMVFESFYIIAIDLKEFTLHVLTTLGQNINDTQFFIMERIAKGAAALPRHVTESLVFIGENVLNFVQSVGNVLLDFTIQLALAPWNVILTVIKLLLQVLIIPYYVWEVILDLPGTGKIGGIFVLLMIVLYWKVNLLATPRIVWQLLKWCSRVIPKIFGLLRNSRKIYRAASSEGAMKSSSPSSTALCVVCKDATVNFISMPCKHVCMCFSCVKTILHFDNRCPYCRGVVTSFERVYIPL